MTVICRVIIQKNLDSGEKAIWLTSAEGVPLNDFLVQSWPHSELTTGQVELTGETEALEQICEKELRSGVGTMPDPLLSSAETRLRNLLEGQQ